MKFQYRQLRADEKLADAARKILETSNIERFCRHPSAPDEPPLLSSEAIAFALSDLSACQKDTIDGVWYRYTPEVLIIGQALFDSAADGYAKVFPTKRNYYLVPGTSTRWADYGTTEALGCEKEFWALLIWGLLHGYEDQLSGAALPPAMDIVDVASFYEDVFGESLSGDTLRKLCMRYPGNSKDAVEVLDALDEEYSVDTVKSAHVLLREIETIKYKVFHAFSAMMAAVLPDIFNERYGITPKTAIDAKILDDLNTQASQAKAVSLITHGIGSDCAAGALAKYLEGSSLLSDEAFLEVKKTLIKYKEMWNCVRETVITRSKGERIPASKWTIERAELAEARYGIVVARPATGGGGVSSKLDSLKRIEKAQAVHLASALEERSLEERIEDILSSLPVSPTFESVAGSISHQDLLSPPDEIVERSYTYGSVKFSIP